jgi:hypothetical protein
MEPLHTLLLDIDIDIDFIRKLVPVCIILSIFWRGV